MAPSFIRRLWDVAFTGIPFGIFKFGGGLAAGADIHPALGWVFIIWGGIDIILNIFSLWFPRRVGHCVLSSIGRLIDRRAEAPWRERAFLAVDTLLAFAIVSTMIWFNRIGGLPEPLPQIWAVAVIASIMGVGIERVWFFFRQREG